MKRSSLWYLQNTTVFSTLPPEESQRLDANTRVTHYAPRQQTVIPNRGDVVFFVVSGSAKLGRRGLLGRRIVETIVHTGDLFGSLSGAAKNLPYYLEPIDALTLLAVPNRVVEECVRHHPECALSIIQMLEDQQRKLLRSVESLMFKDLTTRVVETILWLAREHGDRCEHGWAMDIRLTQQDLADLCGASRQAVSGVLRKLELRFLVRRTGRVLCILSMSRLAKYAKPSA
jgi:CRP/FNR family transcriptional regulator, cyclic AMP receptor protein